MSWMRLILGLLLLYNGLAWLEKYNIRSQNMVFGYKHESFTVNLLFWFPLLSVKPIDKILRFYAEVKQFTQDHLFHQIYCYGLSHVGFNFQKAVYFSSWMKHIREREDDRGSCFHELCRLKNLALPCSFNELYISFFSEM